MTTASSSLSVIRLLRQTMMLMVRHGGKYTAILFVFIFPIHWLIPLWFGSEYALPYPNLPGIVVSLAAWILLVAAGYLWLRFPFALLLLGIRSDARHDKLSWSEMMVTVTRRLPSLLSASGVLVLQALLRLVMIVPAVWYAMRHFFYFPLLVLEQSSPASAGRLSARMVEGREWKVLDRILSVLLIVGSITTAVILFLDEVLFTLRLGGHTWLAEIGYWFEVVILAAAVVACLVFYYFMYDDLRNSVHD